MAYSKFWHEEILNPAMVKNFHNQREELVLLNKAYGMMLAKCGLLAEEDYRSIAKGLDDVLATLKPEDLDTDKYDLYFNIESALYKAIGEETACKLHMGRSRNDVGCAVKRMENRKSIWMVTEQVLSLQDTLLEVAEKNLDTIIPYYTYGKPAQPGTLAHYYVTLVTMLTRDLGRLKAAYANTNRSPMGGAASIGTSFPIDRQLMCDLLGFDSVIENSFDAVASFDFYLEVESAISIMMATLSRVAQDLFFWASDETDMLDCDRAICTGSSIMPQKKNPTGIETVRSKSFHFAGLFVSSLTAQRNTSLFPVRDNLECVTLYWEHLQEALKTIGMLEEVLNYCEIKKDVARNRAYEGFTGAAALAEYITQKFHIPFVKSHHVVGGMVKQLMARNAVRIENMTGALMKQISQEVLDRELEMTDEEIAKVLSPEFCLAAKVTGGTPSSKDTRKLIGSARKEVNEYREWVIAAKEKVKKAYTRINANKIEG